MFIDIKEWNSPVTAQFGINAIPHLVVYGPDGRLVAQGRSATSWLAARHPELFRF